MEKTDPPTSFGVFKPVGHTLIAFHTYDALQDAWHTLLEQGFSSSSMVVYTPMEMQAQVDAQLLNANPIANFGYELDLIRIHKTLAEEECCFLVVETPDDPSAALVADLVHLLQPASAQRYGRFMIEDLTEKQRD